MTSCNETVSTDCCNGTSCDTVKSTASRNVTCNFDYMKPTKEGTERIEAVRAVFKTCETELRSILRPSRETSCCWTDLEKACMMAVKGICLDGEFSV